jgi:hypothetical protein
MDSSVANEAPKIPANPCGSGLAREGVSEYTTKKSAA